MSDKQQPAPKVFISYSWTSDEHTAWVVDLGERLMNDGIEVVLDQWSLEEGHDVNAFMEQMVTDPTIKRVIIVSDSLYTAKADGRRGGVGTETQIISKEVYDSVDQTKFVPLVRERDQVSGEACLPVFLKSRKYIDFSDRDNDAGAYDQLLRNIFERPRRRKPTLGRAPSHIFEEDATVVSSVQKAKRFRDFVVSGRGNAVAAFDDFASEFLANFEELRMTYTLEGKDTWCERIRVNIQTGTAHRDAFVDVVASGVAYLPSEQFTPKLLEFLERILPYQTAPNSAGASCECSEDNYKLLCYELFLYSMSAFVKAKKYDEARKLIDHRYVAPRTIGGNDLEGRDLTRFNRYARSLEEVCANTGDNTRRLSVMADLIHDRATRTDLRFSDVLQADILLWMAAGDHRWFPRTMIYAPRAGKCELFLRAVTEEGFQPLRAMLKMATPKAMLELVQSEKMRKTIQSSELLRAGVDLECMNLHELTQIWGS